MKSPRFVVLTISVALSTVAFAQHDHKSDAQKPNVQKVDVQKPVAPKSDAEKSFDQLKTLAGTWVGAVKVDPPQPHAEERIGKAMRVSLRVTSRGNAMVHEMKGDGLPDDPNKYDNPITMLYLNEDRLLLTHYCDAGNRPRMVAKSSPDGKRVEFQFLDLTGPTNYGHMQNAVFTIIDENHHTEDWTYMLPGDKPVRAHFDLQRTK